jgi:hypothetical protein
MATNHSRCLDRLEEIHILSGRPVRRHRVIGDTEGEPDERTQELIASGQASPRGPVLRVLRNQDHLAGTGSQARLDGRFVGMSIDFPPAATLVPVRARQRLSFRCSARTGNFQMLARAFTDTILNL